MDLKCKLIKKSFTTENGNNQDYYVLVFDLADGTTLDVTLKSDKAKLLIFTENFKNRKV